MRIVVQKWNPEDPGRVGRKIAFPADQEKALLRKWCEYGCPERMIVHDAKTSQTFYLIRGSLTSRNRFEEANKIKGLPEAKSGTGIQMYPAPKNGTPPPVSICDYCKKEFMGKRRFCKPSHKTRFYEKKRAALLNGVLKGLAA